MRILRPLLLLPRCSCSLVFATLGRAHNWFESSGRAAHQVLVALLPALLLIRTTREEVYNVLWALVFAFATLNILSLGARHFESDRRGLTFGEILAILVVLVSVVLLTWEMLYVFRVLPIHLAPR